MEVAAFKSIDHNNCILLVDADVAADMEFFLSFLFLSMIEVLTIGGSVIFGFTFCLPLIVRTYDSS